METLIPDAALNMISRRARPYPAHLLADCETGLVLFAAAFAGHNDAIHFARCGIRTTCIDVNPLLLEEMRRVYPRDWHFQPDDAWRYAEAARTLGISWDAVSVDTFLGDATERSLESLELWGSIAEKLVTATSDRVDVEVPNGWEYDYFPRAPGVYWLVLTR